MHIVKNPSSPTEKADLAVSLAVLVLADAGKDISTDNINSIVAAAGITDLPAIFAAGFSKACSGQDLSKLLAGPKPGAGVAAAGPAATSSSAAAAEAPVEEEKKKEESEADVGAGGLFGDDAGADY